MNETVVATLRSRTSVASFAPISARDEALHELDLRGGRPRGRLLDERRRHAREPVADGARGVLVRDDARHPRAAGVPGSAAASIAWSCGIIGVITTTGALRPRDARGQRGELLVAHEGEHDVGVGAARP